MFCQGACNIVKDVDLRKGLSAANFSSSVNIHTAYDSLKKYISATQKSNEFPLTQFRVS